MEDANASLARQNSRLQERVVELELALTMSLRDRAGARPLPITDGSPGKDRRSPNGAGQAVAFEEVGAILDEWNLGLLRHEESGNPTSEKDRHFLVQTLRSIPDKSVSIKVVDFSLKMLGWIHCALRADQFLIEHEAFQNALIAGTFGVLQDHKWMALYFSVLAVSSVMQPAGSLLTFFLGGTILHERRGYSIAESAWRRAEPRSGLSILSLVS